MTDIVERLRADAEFSQYMADIRKIEIERLQAAGRDLLHAIGHDRKELIDEAVDKMRRALENKP